MISRQHLDAFLDAMNRRDPSGTEAHMAEDVIIYSPIVPEPFKGKQQVQKVLEQLMLTIDAFTPKLLLQDGADFAAIFTLELGPNKLDGMDHMHINEAGLIDSMTVTWRPLPAVVEVQKVLAPKLGGKPLTLVPTTEAETK
jgi:limonene-1,2-epoxide hydrolase